MNWYKKAQAAQQIDWTKEQGKDPLTVRQRDIVNYLVKFHPNDWVFTPDLAEEMGFEGRYFYLILDSLFRNGLIIKSHPYNPWGQNNAMLTDKGRYI